MLELNGEHRDSRFILVRALDHDRVITLRPVGISLCVGLIVLSCLLLQGCPQPMFISVEVAVVRLVWLVWCPKEGVQVRSEEGVLN
jgi:hypothetical protein